ncbi:hypothetical protein ACJ6WH_10170 [Stenotrophomonas maltophilia]|uniref:hypothetical protein n=1 Tax=Stenotrophomonas maltophilia TaxID=40324 RepID=UPI0038968CC5
MTTDNKTLADAQPGGRVRLGDAPFVWSDRAKADALEAGQYAFTEADGKDLGYTDCIEACVDAICSVLALPEHRAALSAHPSPGGQGDAWAIKLAREAAFAHCSDHAYLPQTREETNSWQPHEWVVAAIQAAATSAPKPHDQEPITVEAVAEIFNHPEYGLSINWLLENGIGELQVGDVLMVSDRAITDEEGSGEVYAAPPAHQPANVDLEGLDRALGETIDQRDRCEEVADELAARIASITGVDIGEHSSANCPWQNAIEAAEAYQPAQAVDLERARDEGHDGAIRYVLGYFNGTGDCGSTAYDEILNGCGRERIIRSAVEDGELEFTGLGQWVEMYGTAEDRALIDGKVVGNG